MLEVGSRWGSPGRLDRRRAQRLTCERSSRRVTEAGRSPWVVTSPTPPGAGWSESGYPAMMITDTVLFRYSHYHLPSDTPDKVDYERPGRVTKVLEHVLRDVRALTTQAMRPWVLNHSCVSVLLMKCRRLRPC